MTAFDAAVEAAARAIAATNGVDPEVYDRNPGWSTDSFRQDARAALTAAEPHLRAVIEAPLQAEKDRLDRDRMHEAADRLAYAIAPMEVIGEHSSGNDPWTNALDHVASRAAIVEEVAKAIREISDREWKPGDVKTRTLRDVYDEVIAATRSIATGRCAHVDCTGTPVDRAVFVNPRMDHMNGAAGFCADCLATMADPLATGTET